MAWWDHEELKSPQNRSDRYKVAFPGEYTQQEVDEARKRQENREMSFRMHQDLTGGIPEPAPEKPVSFVTEFGLDSADNSQTVTEQFDPVKTPLRPDESFFVLWTDVDDYGDNSNNGSEECFTVEHALDEINRLDREASDEGADRRFTLVRGVEIELKKSGYSVGD